MITSHTDVIGSLLRPLELLAARDARARGQISESEFKATEDEAVDDAIVLQEGVGLGIATDGEMRRLSFQSEMTEAVDGFGEHNIDAFLWGEWHGDSHVGEWRKERSRTLGVVGKLTRKRHLSAEEFAYLRSRTRRVPKITLPSPGLFVNFWSEDRSVGAYPTVNTFLADVVDVLRDEVTELVRLGATYIQLDAPHYPLLFDPHTRHFYEKLDPSLDHWLAMDNAVMSGFPEVTFGFHL